MPLPALSSRNSAILNSCQLQASKPQLLVCLEGTLLCPVTAQSSGWIVFSLGWFSWPGAAGDGEPSRHLGFFFIDREKSLLSCGRVWVELCAFEGSLVKMELIFSHMSPFFIFPRCYICSC